MDYSYAKLGSYDLGAFRLNGPGLGNLLFPWARFIVATYKHGLQPIAPTWPQFKFGPLIRRETDGRFYVDLFITPANQIHGIRKLFLLHTLPKIREEQAQSMLLNTNNDNRRPRLIVFEGPGNYLREILKDHDLVRRELLRITLGKHKTGLEQDFSNSISVHVRLGDFKQWSLQTPLSWFVNAVREVRKIKGAEVPVHIFSDGTDDELRPLLALPGVRRTGFGSSVADLLALSCANTLIASGGSTFSIWASYLGRMPVLWPPGTNYYKLYYDDPTLEVEYKVGEPLPAHIVKRSAKQQGQLAILS